MSWIPRGDEHGVMFQVTVMRTTEKAMLLKFEDLNREYWIPVSQISDLGEINHRAKMDDEGTVELSPWISKQKGLV